MDNARREQLLQTMKKINKEQGNFMDFAENLDNTEVIKIGIPSIDKFVGGFKKGAFTVAWGGMSCLDADTKVPFLSKTKNGNFKEKKNQSIKRLYEIFNNVQTKGSGKYIRQESLGVEYYLPSVDKNFKFRMNKIQNVIYSGEKEVWELQTDDNHCILSTLDHLYLTPFGYTQLGDLEVGDEIYYHPHTYIKSPKSNLGNHQEINVKYHPFGHIHVVNKISYYRIPKSHVVIEAQMNGLSFDEYRYILNNYSQRDIKQYKFIDKTKYEVHHIDKNRKNNILSNLQLVTKEEHYKIHYEEKANSLRMFAQKTSIISIRKVGIKPTYDITMTEPYPNFVANDLVVHNCGKSTLALQAIANAQKEGSICVYIDMERSFSKERAIQLGVNLQELVLISNCQTAEEALTIIRTLSKDKVCDFLVLDSIQAMSPKGEQENKGKERDLAEAEMAQLARTLSKFFRIVSPDVFKAKIAVLLIGQCRMSLGSFIVRADLSGGEALKHWSYQTIFMRRGQGADAPSQKVVEYYTDPDSKIHKESKNVACGFDAVLKLTKTKSASSAVENSEIHIPFTFENGFVETVNFDEQIQITGTEEEKTIIRQKLIEKGVLKSEEIVERKFTKEENVALDKLDEKNSKEQFKVEPKKRGRPSSKKENK